jgi:glycine/D-amino acid oxidase-like deaminating enzyme
MRLQSYWLDSAPVFSQAAHGDLPARTDVAIIGGGFTGLSAALALARDGANVTVLEAGRVVGEASGRNGGQCNNGLPHDFSGLVRRFGIEPARAFYLAHNAAVDTVERIAREHSIDCDFNRNGRIKLAAKPAHYEQLARSCEVLQRQVDPDVHMVTAAELGREIGSTAFHGGLVQRTSAQLHVGRFGVGLAEAAARHGARIHENTAVMQLRRIDGDAHELVTARGTLHAERVLVATGSTSAGPFGWFQRRLAPVGSFIVVTEPLEKPLLEHLLPTRRNYVTSRHIGNYFRATTDNRLLFGGRAQFAMSNPDSDRQSGRILRATLAGIFPPLANVGIDYCWGGLVDLTADRLPRAGKHDGLYYSMGYSGHGVQMAVYMGQAMAAVIQGRTEANPWRGLDWPAIPFHFGKPWFLPLVGAYYRVLDALQ